MKRIEEMEDLAVVISNMETFAKKLMDIARCDVKVYLSKSHKFLFTNDVYCKDVDRYGNELAKIYKKDILIKKRNPDLESKKEWIDYKVYNYE